MVKAPKSHGLDRKYKPWRRGKSAKSNGKKSSLKHQLRGQERLRKKASDEQHRQEIQQRIDDLKAEIEAKQKMEQERQHAKKSHGVRFLERQRLVRLERNVAKNPNMSHSAKETELTKIALDMAYVAHYPHEIKYIPLFRNGTRVVDAGRRLVKRAKTRQRVLETLSETERVAWISSKQYERLPNTWSLDREKETFGEASLTDTEQAMIQDDRFQVDSKSALLEAADQVEAELDAQQEKEEVHSGGGSHKESSSSDDDDSDSSNSDVEADPLNERAVVNKDESVPQNEQESSDKSGNGSSDDDDSSSDSSSDSDSSQEDTEQSRRDEGKGNSSLPHAEPQADASFEEDDFLIAADKATENVFDHVKHQVPALNQAQGDKSQGWATQRQRPGQFKRRRTRR